MQVLNQMDKCQVVPDSYTCSICGRIFKEASHFTKHKRGALCRKLALRAAKKNKRKVTNSKDGNLYHKSKSSSVNKPYQCNVCAAKFCDKVNVEIHLERQHHTDKQLWNEITKSGGVSCPECDRWFQDKRELKDHQRQHLVNYMSNDRVTETNHLSHVNSMFYTNDQSQQMQQTFLQNQHQSVPLPINNPPQQTPHNPAAIISTSIPSSSHLHDSNGTNLSMAHASSFQTNNNTHIISNPMSILPMQNPSTLQSSQQQQQLQQQQHQHQHQQQQQQQIPSNMVDISSNNNVSNNEASLNPIKTNEKSFKSTSYDKLKVSSNIKSCICGDCGLKFIDVLNLEFHIQRKHPESNILETVNLGGGAILYKTNNTQKYINSFVVDPDSNKNEKNPQSYDCLLCGYKTNGMNSVLSHLQVVHTTNNPNFVHIIETLENKKGTKGNKKKIKSENVLKEKQFICEACNIEFLSKAELIRHKIKDKQFMCSICCFSSCSQDVVSSHMTSHYPNTNSTTAVPNEEAPSSLSAGTVDGPQLSFSPGDMLCWICGYLSPSISSLDDHLATHGTIVVECRECHKSSNSLASITSHLLSTHPQQQISLTLVLTPENEQAVVHNLVVSPEGSINVATIFNTEYIDNVENTVVNETNEDMTIKDITLQEGDMESASTSCSTDDTASRHPATYACIECSACLSGASQLEEHLQMHQNKTSAKELDDPALKPTCTVSSLVKIEIEGSFEFRCEECGFWREKSEPVMRHIHAVHMSGNMLHSVRLPSGSTQIYPIHVVTPISNSVLE